VQFRFWASLLIAAAPLIAEQGVLVLHINDLHDHPIANVRLRAGDSSISAPTGSRPGQHQNSLGNRASADSYGEARIRLAPQTKPGDVILLEIVSFPKDKDLVFISPWEKWVHVPPFENEAKNFIPVILAERGDRACLENSNCIRTAAARISKANAPKSVREPSTGEQREGALAAVAKQFGLKPEEIDHAIRAWGQRTEDPYDKGLASLYEKRYPEASMELAASFERRKATEAEARAKAADAAFFWGQSLYAQGKYRQSAEAYEEAARRRPDDATLLNNLGLSWDQAGEYAKAEPLYRRALTIDEKMLGPDQTSEARDLNNLAGLLQAKSDYSHAEPLYRRALAIDEKALGLDHPDVATGLNNLAGLLQDKGDYTSAEPLYRRALAIDEKTLGPDHPVVAAGLNNLAGLLKAKGDYTTAEPLYRHALAINEKALGPDHPSVATNLSNLAGLLRTKGDNTAAESLYRHALTIDEKALGPNHLDVARDLNNLAGLLQAKGDERAAEPLFRGALAICEKVLGPDHPYTKLIRSNLESLRETKPGTEIH
jgi:tetratricopeptide (TPR) repeat protein